MGDDIDGLYEATIKLNAKDKAMARRVRGCGETKAVRWRDEGDAMVRSELYTSSPWTYGAN